MTQEKYELGALIDLHLHLDGSLSVESAKKLCHLQGMNIPSDKELRELMSAGSNCHSLNDFLTKFEYPCSLLQTEIGITHAVRNLLQELHEDGLIYAEIRFAPQKSMERGLTMQQVVQSAIAGLDDEIIPARIILCCMRGEEEEVSKLNYETIDMVREYMGRGVVAADLAGAEALYPTTDYANLFAYAHKLGVPFTIHAGEAEGAISAEESIRSAINMGAKRIGHGILCYRDETLMKHIKDKGIGLEICPTSNICTEAFCSIEDFPYLTLLNNGIKFCICTDDMTVADVTLRNEYELIRKTFGMDKSVAQILALNAVEMSFAPTELKDILIKKVKA